MSCDRLTMLENEAILILREAYSAFKRIGMLWSIGKDSTALLHLAQKAFFGQVPFPLFHVDTSFKIPEMIAFRDSTVKRLGVQLLVAQNRAALAAKCTFPDGAIGRIECCKKLKTEPLQGITNGSAEIERLNLETGEFEKVTHAAPVDALILGIRGDEEGSRSKERVFSIRARDGRWEIADQPPELWNFYPRKLPPGSTARIHPLINWTELDVWEYIEREKIEVVSLYFDWGSGKRYRSLGCAPCSGTISSTAKNVLEIITELRDGALASSSERSGRAQDKDGEGGLEKLRRGGYM